MDPINRLLPLSLPFFAAFAAAYLVYAGLAWLITTLTRRGHVHALENFSTPRAPFDPMQERPGTQAYKLRLAFAAVGVDATGKENFVLQVTYGSVGLLSFFCLVSLLGFPAWLALIGAGGLSYFVVTNFVAARWEKARLEVEKEIPTLMRNLSGVLQTEQNVMQALTHVVDTLDPARPLAGWMHYLLGEAQARGAPALERLIPEASQISSALGLVVFQLHRLWTIGGQGYAQALRLTADNLADILQVRGAAAAKGAGATSLAQLIIAVAVFTIGYLLRTDVGQQVFLGNQAIVIAMGLAVVWGGFGWGVIRDMVKEATE